MFVTRVFLVVVLCISMCRSFAATEIVHVLPDISAVKKRDKTLLENFRDNYGRLYYFVQELTNNIDDTKDASSFDFVNPEVTVGIQEFSSTIIPGVLLFKNVEKTTKERNSIQEIKDFLSTNYKTNYLPSKVYDESEHIPQPLYVSQLRELLFGAVAKGDVVALRALLDNYNLINATSDDGYNLLSYAILHKQNHIAELLIKRGINLNIVNKYGGTAFIIAARTGNMKILRLIAEHKDCNFHHRDKFGNAAIDYAYITNNRQMQAYLKQFPQDNTQASYVSR
ncbi:MAG: ankyrin repeat domain-containing protein [Rickettsiales bacterium]|nr:ankyrin repeat domain-containing protein [Rickettsiales bacterium]